MAQTDVGTRINGYKLNKFQFKEIVRNWFTNRIVKEWNKLIENVVTAATIDRIKRRSNKYMDDEERW